VPADRLSSAEHAALGNLGLVVDCRRVRLYRHELGLTGLIRRLLLGTSGGRAVALGNHVFLPHRCRGDLAVLAHELTHCGQYQAWGPWRYFSRGVAAQLRHLVYRTTGLGSSPYRYQYDPFKRFEDYGMEQQGQIVEDCFRGDPVARQISPFRPAGPPSSYAVPSA
jgi:hypothetical protein